MTEMIITSVSSHSSAHAHRLLVVTHRLIPIGPDTDPASPLRQELVSYFQSADAMEAFAKPLIAEMRAREAS